MSERTQEPRSSLLRTPARARGPGRAAWERGAMVTGQDILQLGSDTKTAPGSVILRKQSAEE